MLQLPIIRTVRTRRSLQKVALEKSIVSGQLLLEKIAQRTHLNSERRLLMYTPEGRTKDLNLVPVVDKNSLRGGWLSHVVKVSPGQDRWVHVAEIKTIIPHLSRES